MNTINHAIDHHQLWPDGRVRRNTPARPRRILSARPLAFRCGFLELEDREPVDYARAVRQFPPSPAGDVSFRLGAGQTDRGHLEIEHLGDGGTRPVRIVFDDKARVLAVNGNRLVALANYQSSLWSTFTIRAANGRYALIRNGESLLKDAEFSERSPSIYALSQRTGEFRGTVPPDPSVDLPGTEEPHPAVVYRVDDVTSVTSSQDSPQQ